MECPVCLEPLSGTVVHLGCCNNQVHIQCYLPKCPLCRAELQKRDVRTRITLENLVQNIAREVENRLGNPDDDDEDEDDDDEDGDDEEDENIEE